MASLPRYTCRQLALLLTAPSRSSTEKEWGGQEEEEEEEVEAGEVEEESKGRAHRAMRPVLHCCFDGLCGVFVNFKRKGKEKGNWKRAGGGWWVLRARDRVRPIVETSSSLFFFDLYLVPLPLVPSDSPGALWGQPHVGRARHGRERGCRLQQRCLRPRPCEIGKTTKTTTEKAERSKGRARERAKDRPRGRTRGESDGGARTPRRRRESCAEDAPRPDALDASTQTA